MGSAEEILNIFQNLRIPEGRHWNKLRGDAWARLVAYYIQKRLNLTLKVVGPNVYIDGFPTEFDLLVVRQSAEPQQFTAAYLPQGVVAAIEVKEHGVFGGRQHLRIDLGKMKAKFDAVATQFSHISCVYLTMKEVSQPKRAQSINYLEETRKGLAYYQVFCLQDSRTGTIIPGEWERFVQLLERLPERMA
jgi:hypothetical protein